MAESQVPPPRIVNLVLPTAVVAALAFAGYVAFVPTLESSRPRPSEFGYPTPPSPEGMTGRYARLWEDPLEAAHRYDDEVKAAEAAEQLDALQEHMANLVLPNDASDGDARLHVMAVMLPGEPHAESGESRRRIRYAVTSGLGVAGYHLAFPDRMTYLDVPLIVKINAVKAKTKIALRVPIKLYRVSELRNKEAAPDFSRLLVLWVNESRLGSEPISSIATMLSKLFGDERLRTARAGIRFSVIGPTSSDTLVAMAREVAGNVAATVNDNASTSPNNASEQTADGATEPPNDASPIDSEDQWPRSTMTVYSYRATIGGAQLEDQSKNQDAVRAIVNGTWELDDAPNDAFGASRAPRFVRTIGSDKQLIDELFRELELRQAMPDSDRSDHHVVILTERDTLYGRGLHELFRYAEASPEAPKFGVPQSKLHLFNYLRGIDGQTQTKSAQRSADAGKDSSNRVDPSSFETELPTGPSQYDYIRRVAQQVVQLQTRLRQRGQGHICAVGVMGSDVYDKLLILRALRGRLPNAVYFTTDLDAALSHASEYEWTRNVVVASHFGRQLHPTLHREAPVFRDSYQTSCFLTTLLAADDDIAWGLFAKEKSERDVQILSQQLGGANSDTRLRPLVFEMSRTGPFQLTWPEGPTSEEQWFEQWRGAAPHSSSSLTALVHPLSDRSVRSMSPKTVMLVLVSLLLIAVCLAVNLSVVRTLLANLLASVTTAVKRIWKLQATASDAFVLLGLLATAAFAAAVALDTFRSNGEPFTAVGGISVWPTVVLRTIAAALAGYFSYEAVRTVHSRQQGIGEEFKLSPTTESSQPKLSVLAVDAALHWRKWRNLLPDKIYDAELCKKEPMGEKWNRLINITRTQSIVVRVAPQIVLFVLFAYLISPLGAPRSRPVRGNVASVLESISFLASLIGIIILTFVVLDLTQCCRYFAKCIRKSEEIRWRNRRTASKHAAGQPPPGILEYRWTIQVLALLSKTFSKLILYPSVVLVMLILAHLSMFDYWTVSWPLLVLISICIFAALYGNFSLRNEVRNVRESVLRGLRKKQFEMTQTASSEDLSQVNQVISEIGAERGGAFRPLAEDPLIQAISLPFGGVGGAVLIEHLFRSMG